MSKGGSTSSQVEIPAWLENAAIENINRARDVQKIGYTPYYGPDVAAFTPMQEQAMGMTGSAAQAFGLAPQGFDPMAGMPQAQEFEGGIRGYSSAPLYEQSVDTLHQERPGQAQAIEGMFIDPVTGEYSGSNYAPTVQQILNAGYAQGGDEAAATAIANSIQSSSDGGYYGVNDQFNPYNMQMPSTDLNGDGSIDMYDASFGEAGRRQVGTAENLINTLNPFGMIGKAMDYGSGLLEGFTPSPSNGLLTQTSGAMEQTEAQKLMNDAVARYDARVAAEEAAKAATMARQEALLAPSIAAPTVSAVNNTPTYEAQTFPLYTPTITNNSGSNYNTINNNSNTGTVIGGGKTVSQRIQDAAQKYDGLNKGGR